VLNQTVKFFVYFIKQSAKKFYLNLEAKSTVKFFVYLLNIAERKGLFEFSGNVNSNFFLFLQSMEIIIEMFYIMIFQKISMLFYISIVLSYKIRSLFEVPYRISGLKIIGPLLYICPKILFSMKVPYKIPPPHNL